jgi:hypothetical protein
VKLRLDNKNKWRIVGIVAFALALPMALGQAGVVHDILRLGLCLAPPAVALWFLPFTQLVRGIVVILYLFLMYPAAKLPPSAGNCGVKEACL